MPWCFAVVNNRLAEIYFHKKKNGIDISGHCYVNRDEYNSKQEQKWIAKDTARFRFNYRKGRYRDVKQDNV